MYNLSPHLEAYRPTRPPLHVPAHETALAVLPLMTKVAVVVGTKPSGLVTPLGSTLGFFVFVSG